MEKLCLLFASLVVSFLLFYLNLAIATGTDDGSEQWGYVEVRPKAHLFWWLYRSPYRVEDPSNPWPTLLWLQGGPGASGVGFGNFAEIGPLDGNLEPRNLTWLRKADLLFVDSPVGTGFSYMEDENLAVRTDEESATDLTTLLKVLFNGNANLQKSPLYIFAESYGGKFAVTLAVSAVNAIEAGELKLQLGGVALGDSWISPGDFMLSWGPLLKDVSRIDNNALNTSNSLALKVQQQLAEGKYQDAFSTSSELYGFLDEISNSVDFYNFMYDSGNSPISSTTIEGQKGLWMESYSRYLSAKKFSSTNGASFDGDLSSLMNGPIRDKLKIIPKNVSWVDLSWTVYDALTGDFTKPRIQEVNQLLAKGINVTIYNGQLDVICATKGAEAWVEKLQWDGLKSYLSLDRTPLYCGNDDTVTKGFVRSYKNLFFYWILGAGHFVLSDLMTGLRKETQLEEKKAPKLLNVDKNFDHVYILKPIAITEVPAEQPCVSLQMVGSITRSPN